MTMREIRASRIAGRCEEILREEKVKICNLKNSYENNEFSYKKCKKEFEKSYKRVVFYDLILDNLCNTYKMTPSITIGSFSNLKTFFMD